MSQKYTQFLRKYIRLAFASYYIHVLGLLTAFAGPPAEFGYYSLVFSDEFDGLDLGFSEDGPASRPHNWYEGVWFSKHHAPPRNFVTGNSTLSLIWTRGQQQPDSSIATFSRRNSHYHAWRYGYFEVRMKWQPEQGAWPAVWLIPVQAAADGPHESGEIDIFEGQGSQPRTFFATIHHWYGSHDLENSSLRNHFPLPPETDFREFHTYGLLWVPGRMTWYFDGLPLHSEPTFEIFDKQDYYLILSMQEGSNWKEGDLTGVSAQRLSLSVDWVRVWQPRSH